jgi:hypothetical protein
MPGITKSLTPEEKTIISNIESLISQLKQMDAGGDMKPETPAEIGKSKDCGGDNMDMKTVKVKLMKGEPLDDEETLTLLEALGTSGPEAIMESEDSNSGDPEPPELGEMTAKATGSDSAEDRLGEDQEPTTQDAVTDEGGDMKQLIKAVQGLASKFDVIQKSSSENSKAIAGILEGIGFADQITKSSPTDNTVKKSQKPQVAMSVEDVLALVGKSAGAEPVEDRGTGLVEPFAVRKSTAEPGARSAMGGIMSGLFGSRRA